MRTKKPLSIYLEWVNNWVTIKGMADYYNISAQDLGHIIDQGRKENELLAEAKIRKL